MRLVTLSILFASIGVYAPAASASCPKGYASITRKAQYPADTLGTALRTVDINLSYGIPESGFSSLPKLRQALRTSGGNAEKVAQMLEKEDVEIVIRRPEQSRLDFLENQRLRNFYETGKTMGDGKVAAKEDALRRRAIIESSYLRMDANDYFSQIPHADKPKSGYLRPAANIKGRAETPGVTNYGKDGWILKTKSVRDRTTLTFGDSIDRVPQVFPNAYRGSGWFDPFLPSRWDNGYIPWHDRLLFAPELARRFSDSKAIALYPTATKKNYQEFFKKKKFSALSPYHRTPNIKNATDEAWVNASQYLETQTFYEIGLKDIQGFEFTQTPPSGDFLRLLRKNKIEVWDARKWPPKPWKE